MGLHCRAHFRVGFFPINIQSALCISRVSNLQVQPSVTHTQYFPSVVGKCGCNGPTVCVVLWHFIYGTWASIDFDIKGILEPIPCWYQWMTIVKFEGSQKLYVGFQMCVWWGRRGVTIPNPQLVQGSTIILLKSYHHDLDTILSHTYWIRYNSFAQASIFMFLVIYFD